MVPLRSAQVLLSCASTLLREPPTSPPARLALPLRLVPAVAVPCGPAPEEISCLNPATLPDMPTTLLLASPAHTPMGLKTINKQCPQGRPADGPTLGFVAQPRWGWQKQNGRVCGGSRTLISFPFMADFSGQQREYRGNRGRRVRLPRDVGRREGHRLVRLRGRVREHLRRPPERWPPLGHSEPVRS